ncbi:helix-turn-helix domain-containing protein [Microbacterium sp. A1-JK]|uniref:helix-turn-helix domain-containing protein n=1 Tax=Microbacterium sp. A1-JK TaxID=3177516 RepID=UPI003889EBF3
MASGAQGRAEGLAKHFADFVRRGGLTHDEIAKGIGMSKTYTSKRINGEGQFTLKDFERYAVLLGLEPQELLARVRLPEALEYDGRLVPEFEVVSGPSGRTVYLTRGVDPAPRPVGNVIEGRFGVGPSIEDEPGIQQPPADVERTAARKGTRKADQAPHAE